MADYLFTFPDGQEVRLHLDNIQLQMYAKRPMVYGHLIYSLAHLITAEIGMSDDDADNLADIIQGYLEAGAAPLENRGLDGNLLEMAKDGKITRGYVDAIEEMSEDSLYMDLLLLYEQMRPQLPEGYQLDLPFLPEEEV